VNVHEAFGTSEGEPAKEGVVGRPHPSIVGRAGDSVCHSTRVDFAVQVTNDEGLCIVSAVGELDVHSAPILQARLDPLSGQAGGSLVVDLSGVGFIDSTGLGVLVTTLKHVREAGGTLDIVASSPRVLKVFALTGLDVVIPLHATLAEAVRPA